MNISVSQTACHTLTAPKIRLNARAADMMSSTYRRREIIRGDVPLPRPSGIPLAVIEMADAVKPRLIRCSAVRPV